MLNFACKLIALCFLTVPLVVFAQIEDTAATSQESVLYAFKGNADGGEPWGRVISDQAGNLYGTTLDEYGGNGTVYELSPAIGGGWSKTILYSFQGGTDGFGVTGGLVFDTSGNLYGMTGQGGLFGFGTVFELMPNSAGGWTKIVLHNFNYTDGYLPVSSLVFDQSGNLFGMTPYGGSGCTAGCGVIFELTKSKTGWKESVIHRFSGGDGYGPLGALTFDKQGNLYGAASASGTDDRDGVVFKLQVTGSGWTYSVLHTFYNAPPKCNVGNFAGEPPTLLLDQSGNIYGPAQAGGPHACTYGTIWELSPSQGKWSLKVLYAFSRSIDGYPKGSLTPDQQGNL